eukprot:GHVT01099179.1.p1 GENE.GHVT01099179.1~~GHVT01099179.1.p1  ORF type:complete len:291 (+),score=58.38 GHVT01099179.1:510-1382(+)
MGNSAPEASPSEGADNRRPRSRNSSRGPSTPTTKDVIWVGEDFLQAFGPRRKVRPRPASPPDYNRVSRVPPRSAAEAAEDEDDGYLQRPVPPITSLLTPRGPSGCPSGTFGSSSAHVPADPCQSASSSASLTSVSSVRPRDESSFWNNSSSSSPSACSACSSPSLLLTRLSAALAATAARQDSALNIIERADGAATCISRVPSLDACGGASSGSSDVSHLASAPPADAVPAPEVVHSCAAQEAAVTSCYRRYAGRTLDLVLGCQDVVNNYSQCAVTVGRSHCGYQLEQST